MTAKSKSARRSAPACPFPMAMQTLQILSRDCLNAKKKRRTGDEDGSHDIAPSVFQNDRKGLCSALRSSIVEICNVLNFYRSEGADVLGRRYEHSGSDVIHVSDGIDVEQIWWQIQRKFSGVIFCINEKTIDEDHNESIDRSEPPCSPTGRRKKDSSNARELEEVLGQYEDRNGTNQKKSAKSGRDKHYVFGKPGIDEKDEEEDASEHHQSAPDASSMSQTSAANSDEEDLAHHLMYGTENSDDSEDNEGKPLDDELRRRFESKNEDGDDIADIARDVEHALSVYQQTQRDMNEQIAQQEEILMREKKHWTLTGEVGAVERPKDALLDETLDAEFVVQEPPECTEEVTLSLEECIRKRIRDQQFDNPTRRAALTKPSDVASHTRPDPHEQERSKTSLVDLYEKEYMEKLKKMAYDRMDANGGKQVSKELSQEEKDELKTLEMWRTVSAHLDALSNAFYTPKLTFESAQDLRVRASQAGAAAGAVSIEDRGAAATLLANRNGIVDQETTRASQGNTTNASSRHCAIGTSELTSTERKRLRRGKKEASKKKRKEKESTEECNRKGSEDRHGKLAARVKRQEQIRMSKLLPADLAKRSASTSQKTVVTRRTGSKSRILKK